jgi:hypothetical protein
MLPSDLDCLAIKCIPVFRGMMETFSVFISHITCSHCGGPGLVKWDLWWTKWCRGRFSPSTLVSPPIHSTKFSILTITQGRYNRPVNGRRAEWIQFGLHPPLWKKYPVLSQLTIFSPSPTPSTDCLHVTSVSPCLELKESRSLLFSQIHFPSRILDFQNYVLADRWHPVIIMLFLCVWVGNSCTKLLVSLLWFRVCCLICLV